MTTDQKPVVCWQSPIDKHIEVIRQVADTLNPGQLMEVGYCKFCGKKIKEYRRQGIGRCPPECIPYTTAGVWRKSKKE